MKILHCADIHLGDLNGPIRDGKNARRQDTLDCMNAIVATAKEEHPHIAIIAGDLFNRSRVWADTALEDVNDAIIQLLRPLCGTCGHVVLLFGTDNHDNPRAFEVIAQTTQSIKNLHIYTAPGVHTLRTSDGDIQILALPGFDKGRLRSFMPDADKEAENRNATALINDVLLGLSTKLDKEKPSVLVAHYTVAGADTGNNTAFLAGQDVVLLPQTIDATGVTLACLGHIHKAQKLNCNTPAFYCGSPNELTFNDEDNEHGFYIHTLETAGIAGTPGYWRYWENTFIPTPARRHLTIRFEQNETAQFIQTGKLPDIYRKYDFTECIVRVRYRATAEQDKALNKAELQKQLLAGGAFHVAEILREDEDTSTGAIEELGDESPATLLARHLDAIYERLPQQDRNLAQLNRQKELAAPLIRKADDGRETDRHVGAFIPKRIEVKNYRSYTAADFDFSDIRMAMVNGQNGVGKSSLFMDAIADCLFEVSRDEAIGGWLREGEKSGAITFEFEIGGADYRVTRTRMKSGKGTLALNRKGDTGEWEDCGDTTIKLTQAKIERALGMDCQTFCSIALIRQDAYGLFLEADSDRRMEVLSALLNLGIYVRLEELAKVEAAEQRKKLASLKDRMSVLSEQISAKEATDAELKETERLAAETAQRIEELDAAIATAQKAEALLKEITRQADEKEQEARTLESQATKKETELEKLKEERTDALNLAAMTEAAQKASAAITADRNELETIAPYEAEFQVVAGQRSTLTTSIGNIQNRLKANGDARQNHQAILARRDEIQAAVATLEGIRTERVENDKRMAEYISTKEKFSRAVAERDAFLAECRQRISEHEARLKTAQEKATLLKDSNCPIVDTATCAFLKDAQEAKAQIDGLQTTLGKVKADDKATYGEYTLKIETARIALASMTHPNEAAEALAAREREAATIAALAPKLEAAAATITELDKQSTEHWAALKEAETALAKIDEKLPDLKKKAKRADDLRARIKENEPAANLLAKCTAAAATVKGLDARITEAEANIKTARDAAQTARQAAGEARANMPPGGSNIASLAQSKREKESYKTTLYQRAGGLAGKLEAIKAAATTHEQYRAETQDAARTLNDYTTLAQAFGIDGIQYMIIRTIVPEIMNRANEILAAMTGGKMAVDLRTEREQKSNQKIINSLDVWITSLSGGSSPYSSHSGGEKVKIALAVTLALADVKARRAGAQLGTQKLDNMY